MTKHITVTSWWARWRLKSPASRLFTQPFIQAQIKENIKALRLTPSSSTAFVCKQETTTLGPLCDDGIKGPFYWH